LFGFRSKNYFLVFNNPSAEYLDKELINGDLINFFVFIHAKQHRYYLFTRTQIQSFLSRFENLRPQTLKSYGDRFATFDGYFTKYVGDDWDRYLVLKNQRVEDKMDAYIEKYAGGVRYSLQKGADYLGIHRQTLRKYLDDAIASGALSPSVRLLSGQYSLSLEDLESLRLGGVV
jgi:DNA-binding protein Fis